jgi:hypothetical protein
MAWPAGRPWRVPVLTWLSNGQRAQAQRGWLASGQWSPVLSRQLVSEMVHHGGRPAELPRVCVVVKVCGPRTGSFPVEIVVSKKSRMTCQGFTASDSGTVVTCNKARD